MKSTNFQCVQRDSSQHYFIMKKKVQNHPPGEWLSQGYRSCSPKKWYSLLRTWNKIKKKRKSRNQKNTNVNYNKITFLSHTMCRYSCRGENRLARQASRSGKKWIRILDIWAGPDSSWFKCQMWEKRQIIEDSWGRSTHKDKKGPYKDYFNIKKFSIKYLNI